jgi:ABC-2 type transport system permease protein
MDLKSKFGGNNFKSPKTWVKLIFNLLFSVAIFGVLAAGIYFLSQMFLGGAPAGVLDHAYLTIVIGITFILETLVCTAMLIKNLFYKGDNELLLRFPVSGSDILTAKSISVITGNFVIGLALSAPFYVSYGVITSASAGYYLLAFGVFVLTNLTSFFLANVISIPVMGLINLIKNQFLIVLILLIVILAGSFAVYMTLLSTVIEYLQEREVSLMSAEIVKIIQDVTIRAYPIKWFADIFVGKRPLLGFISTLAIAVLTGVIGMSISHAAYFKIILHGIETEKTTFKRKTTSRKRTIFGTILHREFFLIFRSFNYSFQYFAMAAAAPVMVYFCNKMASLLGAQSVGARIVPGLTLLVVAIFITIIVSFASTAISREGGTFYQTKTIPVSYVKQVLAKIVLYDIVATISVALCCAIVYVGFSGAKNGNIVAPRDVFSIFIISELLVITLTCISLRADVKTPTFNVSGDGELVTANKNVSLAILLGALVAIGYGLFAMIFSYMPLQIGDKTYLVNGIKSVYNVLFIFTGAMAVISVIVLFAKLNKNYEKIVP